MLGLISANFVQNSYSRHLQDNNKFIPFMSPHSNSQGRKLLSSLLTGSTAIADGLSSLAFHGQHLCLLDLPRQQRSLNSKMLLRTIGSWPSSRSPTVFLDPPSAAITSHRRRQQQVLFSFLFFTAAATSPFEKTSNSSLSFLLHGSSTATKGTQQPPSSSIEEGLLVVLLAAAVVLQEQEKGGRERSL